MTFPKFQHTPVSLWLAEAATEFVNGFIDGWGGAAGAGAGTGVITGTTSLGHDMSGVEQVLISGVSAGASLLLAGIQAVYVWHKTHRFPNPWPASTGNTLPPFAPSVTTQPVIASP